MKPNFIIAGEAKAGTTALHAYLTQHPEVFMCEPKEPRYFGFSGQRPDFSGPMDEERFNESTVYEKNKYYDLFQKAQGFSAVGEASPIYMHMPDCAKAIASELPDTKIIILLRNPVELAFSAFQHMLRNGYEELSFEEGLKLEKERISQNWAWHWRYFSLGLVAKNIKSFLHCFSRDQLLFINYDDFKKDNKGKLVEVCDFLGIAQYNFQYTRKNINARPRIAWLRDIVMNKHSIIKKILRPFIPVSVRRKMTDQASKINLKQVNEQMNPETYAQLITQYTDDIRKSQDLTGLDLSAWLKR